ncbi:sugar phosphate isomerase/epimerase family protein [Aquibacillus salsiterrae]|uniref:Sugar phosphate isomerase/epimerase n=1 Tax=Aquibacillus salsiterrae TaxID=2950439 RepID=A0A9X4ADY2_9BACI|nr:sugar phosphate isomerase/epimerase family protein [Aquibacillus salsiterrae]MDC3416036.1 sugar phosphate isomerase/epimerase [Aquibacillus salsiterrae]
MRFGVCADINRASEIYKAGYDFIECTVISLVPDDDRQFSELFHQYKESPVPIEACNVFLPGNLKIVGDSVDEDSIRTYLEKALPRVKKIGADTVVFGSGGARTLPIGFERSRGEEQIVQFLNLVADYADDLELTVVIEPLNRKESNIINSVTEGLEFVNKVNRPSIKLLADFYHMDEENESLVNIVVSKEHIRHIHVADTGRLAPGTGHYPYEQFVNTLSTANYDGRISIECSWDDFERESVAALQYLRDTFSK